MSLEDLFECSNLVIGTSLGCSGPGWPSGEFGSLIDTSHDYLYGES